VSEAVAGAKDVRLFRNARCQTWRGDVLKGRRSKRLTRCCQSLRRKRLTAYAFNREQRKHGRHVEIKGAASLKREGTAYVLRSA